MRFPSPRRAFLALLIGPSLFAHTALAQFNALPTINVIGSGNIDTETDYVPNVVEAENGLASFEALKAQAVAARTYAYYRMDQTGSIQDGTVDQVYSNGRPPRQIHLEAARATEGEILWVRDDIGVQNDVLIAAFYVAGAIPNGPFNPDNPGVIVDPGDSDPTTTEQWVTYTYADNLISGFNTGTPLGFQGSPTNPNWPNRGAKSQNGADYLSDNSVNYLDILKYYYGADIQLRTATTAGTTVDFGRKVLADFDDYGSGRSTEGIIDGNEGVFHRSPTFSGSTTANLAGSDASRDGTQAHEGSHSQRIDIEYNESSGSDFFLRHVAGAKYSNFGESTIDSTGSGDFNGDLVVDAADYTIWRDAFNTFQFGHPADANGDGFVAQGDYQIWADNFGENLVDEASTNAGERIANLQFESIGSVGVWLKTTDPGLEVSIAIDDPNTGDRGVKQQIIADGQWHQYEWFLDVAADWEAWTAEGNGQINGLNVSLDSIQLFGSSDATVYLDTVFWDPQATPNAIAVPEPTAILLLGFATATFARRRR